MIRRIVKTGNSTALILTRDMKEHLGIGEFVDVQFSEGQIVLRRPVSFEEAHAKTDERYRDAYEDLSK